LRTTAEERGCLFCRRGDGGFIGREHVFPESLGNTEIVLPSGVVCDRCNNGVLSELDQVICEFMPVAVRRTILGIRSKAGKIPAFRFCEGTVEHVPGTDGADPNLILNSHTSPGMLRETGRLSGGRLSLEWKGSGGRRMTPRYASQLSRGLLKSALECSWIDHGKIMLEPRFDHIRAAVLGEPRDGLFVMLNTADPSSGKVSLTYELMPYDDDTWRMVVWADYYGVFLGTDSRLSCPVRALPEDQGILMTFTTSDFRAA
jgi:hypothetical protein